MELDAGEPDARTERDVELLLVTRPKPGGQTEKMIDRLAIGDAVRFVNGITDEQLAALVASAEIACVPSLYEGFSLPTVEAMACATPLVVSRAGAIPEVVGPEGLCADLVTPGDVGELDADGCLFLRGRAKDVIDVQGMKFFPQEVEAVLLAHPRVAAACVVPRPHLRLGEVPHAQIVVKPDADSPSPDELRSFCQARLAAFKVPEEFEFVETLEQTASGKVRHRTVVET